jgi:hypothetical protein
MKPGGGKAKGAAFEREVCRKLSLWVTSGKRSDVFWRSAMSGGRATVMTGKAGKEVRQSGDVTSVAPEGHWFTENVLCEIKHVKSLDLESAVFRRRGALVGFWHKVARQAERYDQEPMIIAKQNRYPTMIIASQGFFDGWFDMNQGDGTIYDIVTLSFLALKPGRFSICELMEFDVFLKQPVDNIVKWYSGDETKGDEDAVQHSDLPRHQRQRERL